jgi:hypothetical protein
MYLARLSYRAPNVLQQPPAAPPVLKIEEEARAAPSTTAKTNRSLKQYFERNKELLDEIAKNARFIAPGVLDPYSVLEAEETVALRRADRKAGGKFYSWLNGDRAAIKKHFEEQRRELAKTVPRDMIDRWKWAKGVLKEEVADQEATVGALERRRDALKQRISKLEEMDARTREERDAGEPPHPPWAQLHKAKEELKSLEDELGVEKRILRDLEKELPAKLQDLDQKISDETRSRKFRKKVWDAIRGK